MLFKEIVAVYIKNHTRHLYKMIVDAGGTYGYHCVLKLLISMSASNIFSFCNLFHIKIGRHIIRGIFKRLTKWPMSLRTTRRSETTFRLQTAKKTFP